MTGPMRMLAVLAVAVLAPGSAATAAWAAPPQVAADIAPVHSLVAQVMGERGTPALVLPPGASPHHHAMRPSEARAMAAADLVVWTGPDLVPWLADRIDALAPDAGRLALSDLPGTVRQSAEAAHDHTDNGHGHGHGAADPHTWLDPANARHWLGAIAARLASLDPEGAETYRANAEAAEARLVAVEARIAARMAPLSDRPFLVYHDAYRGFVARFGLRQAGALTGIDAIRPGAAGLSEARDLVARHPGICIFAEPQMPARLLTPLAEGLDARLGTLDPLGSDIPPGPGHYAAMLEALAEDFEACLAPGAG